MVPKGTTVIYSDYDPVIVEYAREILKDTPNVYFFQGDARHPEELLNRPEVTEILKGRRDIGIVFWGVSLFLNDDDIAHAARVGRMGRARAASGPSRRKAPMDTPDDPSVANVIQVYASIGTPMHFRSLDRFRELVVPWHPDEHGYISLLDWHGFDKEILSGEDEDAWGQAGGNFGAYLIK